MNDFSTVSPAEDPARRVELAYASIAATRMAGLPFLNSALRVEAVGFRRWNGQWLGVLVTPWSMNLLLLPDAAAQWTPLPQGGERHASFPAGNFRFISGHDDLLGEHHSCSLFSPMLEFADQEGARLTALAALDALFDAANAEPDGAPRPEPTAAGPLEEIRTDLSAPMSKRDFLRGRYLVTNHDDRG
jgi:[NiFe] hydrogenase assembly HybE family chaperone